MSFSKKHGFLEKFSILLHNHRYKRRYRELFSKCLQGRKKISEEVVNRSITEHHKTGKGWSRIYNKIRIPLLCTTSIRKHSLTRFRQGSGMGIHLCNGNSHGSLSFALYHNKTSMPKSNKKELYFLQLLRKHVIRVHKNTQRTHYKRTYCCEKITPNFRTLPSKDHAGYKTRTQRHPGFREVQSEPQVSHLGSSASDLYLALFQEQ